MAAGTLRTSWLQRSGSGIAIEETAVGLSTNPLSWIGVYQDDRNRALFRTFWPLFWFGVLADSIAEIPFSILRKLEVGAADTSRGPARFFRGIVSLFVWFTGIAASVLGILEFFGLRDWCLKLIGWK